MSRKWSMTHAVRGVALLMAVLLTVVAGLASGGAATAQSSPSAKTVAHNPLGSMTSKIVGTTNKGQTVTGSFVPLSFTKKSGTERVHGLLQGVIHKKNGSTQTFSTLRTMKVKSVGGTPLSGRQGIDARATCNILNLVLAPLDLNLLGLQIHLDRVVLNIVAVSGAGNLLGNLLCSVAHLLDGGLGGLLGQLTDLLNQILAALGLGL
jgi:hypothetical protein